MQVVQTMDFCWLIKYLKREHGEQEVQEICGSQKNVRNFLGKRSNLGNKRREQAVIKEVNIFQLQAVLHPPT